MPPRTSARRARDVAAGEGGRSAHVAGARAAGILTPVNWAFRHEALFYAGQDDYLAATVPFVREGLEAGEAVLVAAPAERVELLRGALDGDAGRVRFEDMARIGRNPARIIPAWREFHDAHGGRVRGIGEPIWAGRSADELVECQHHESLLNLAFADAGPWRLLCPYDTTALPEDVVEAARRSHPSVTEHGATASCAHFVPPERAPSPFQGPLDPAPRDAASLTFGRADMRRVRLFTGEHAGAAGLDDARRADVVLAVNELAANSVRHARGQGTVRCWRGPGALVYEVADRGRIDEPLTGRVRPGSEQLSGRGLWMANHLCDLVQIRSGAHGTLVRLSMGAA